MIDTPPVLNRKQKFHIRTKSCPYDFAAAKTVEMLLHEACQQGFEPVGIVLTPGSKESSYFISMYFKIECSGDGCLLCREDLRRSGFSHKLAW